MRYIILLLIFFREFFSSFQQFFLPPLNLKGVLEPHQTPNGVIVGPRLEHETVRKHSVFSEITLHLAERRKRAFQEKKNK